MSRSLNSITIVAVRCRRALIQINLFEPFGREQVSGPLQAEEIVFHRRSYRFLLQEFSAIEDVALVIILADEPTGILDTTSVATVRDIPMVLARQRGRTFAFVTHGRQFASEADRTIMVTHGRIARPSCRLQRGGLAGAEGFEPSNAGIKIRCLTTWRRPNRPETQGLPGRSFGPGGRGGGGP